MGAMGAAGPALRACEPASPASVRRQRSSEGCRPVLLASFATGRRGQRACEDAGFGKMPGTSGSSGSWGLPRARPVRAFLRLPQRPSNVSISNCEAPGYAARRASRRRSSAARQVRADRADWRGGHGRGAAGAAARGDGVREAGGRQARPRAPRFAEVLRGNADAGGAAGRAGQAPQRRRHLRSRRVRGALLRGDGVPGRRADAGAPSRRPRRQAPRPAVHRAADRRGRRGADRRPPAAHDGRRADAAGAPRHLAGQHHGALHRPGQAGGLRRRQGRRRRAGRQGSHQGQVRLHGPREAARRGRRCPQRSVLARRGAVGGAHLAPPVSRRHRSRGHRPGARGSDRAAVADQRRGAQGLRRHLRQGARAHGGSALPDRRRDGPRHRVGAQGRQLLRQVRGHRRVHAEDLRRSHLRAQPAHQGSLDAARPFAAAGQRRLRLRRHERQERPGDDAAAAGAAAGPAGAGAAFDSAGADPAGLGRRRGGAWAAGEEGPGQGGRRVGHGRGDWQRRRRR